MRVLAWLFLILELTRIVFGKYGDVLEYVGEYLIHREAIEFIKDCESTNLSVCFKEQILKYLESVPNSINIGGGLKVKQNDGSRRSRQHSSIVLPNESRARDDILDNLLLERVTDFMRSYRFEYEVPEESINELEKSIEEGRKKKGGGGMRMKPFLILLQIKAAALGAIALKLIGIVAFKALLVGKMALTIVSVIALKKLVETKHHSSTYEVHTHPLYDEHGSFDRSFHQDLSYKGHK